MPFLIGIVCLGQLETLDSANLRVWDDGLSVHYQAFTNRSFLGVNFLKVMTMDGVDYVRDLKPSDVLTVPINVQPDIYFNLPACQTGRVEMTHPYWQNFTYDPSLTALYGGPEDGATPPSSVQKDKRLPSAAYIVPIVLVAVIIIVVAVLVLVPPFNKIFVRKIE